ncbi:hypothetical protein [Epilithonimonas vandammei]|uniref:Uncharacterized protein n=1 Tax=Epilithonimonas vandammei TaxID=2487072 RepID=A0A3G8YBS1_9FLAO|nr:hypothetical protein [Epilithonimonas vandammei]AZI38621.1 hypothetical protein EIB74_00965 [Epilithonimonas vandammei]
MKTKKLLLGIFLLSAIFIWGQKDSIVYDFKAKELSKSKVRYNKPYYLVIKNINRYIYGIDISQKNIELLSKPPESFTTYFGKGIMGLDQGGHLTTNVDNKIDNFVTEFEKYEKIYRQIKLGIDIKVLPESFSNNEKLAEFINDFRLIKKNKTNNTVLLDKLATIEFDEVTEPYITELAKCIYYSLEKNAVYRSYPVYLKGNTINYDITFTKYGLNSSQEKVEEEKGVVNFDLFVRNKPFISFSTGPFIGIHNNFKTGKYSWKPMSVSGTVPENPKYELLETGQNTSPFGLAAFANIGVKTSRYIGFATTIGAGATIENSPKIAYFAGLSTLIGNEKQFNITGGWSFIQTETLKYNLYDGNLLYSVKPADIEYNKKFKGGWFLSLSYTLFSTEVKETKITANPTVSGAEKK